MHFLLFYELHPDYLERRASHRAEHLKLAWAASERGELLLGGPYTDPLEGAALLFKCESSETPERFAAADPYVKHGVVTRYWVRGWNTVVGPYASSPVRLE